ncbi:MAG: hypothetical protein R6U26_00490 [Candidatus Undinarchaeales archaeon]
MDLKLTDEKLKKLMVVPFIILGIALLFLSMSYMETGQFLKRGIDLEGGIQITVPHEEKIDTNDFELFLEGIYEQSDIEVVTTTDPATRQPQSVVVSVSGDPDEAEVLSSIEDYLDKSFERTEYSVTAVGPALAGNFWQQAKMAFAFAFILMMVVVAVTYKSVAPSAAIILSTVYDFTVVLGAMAFFDIRLSLASFAALLMIIGYEVDTNILITDKIIKQDKGGVFERLNYSLKTGLTVSGTTLSVLLALFFFTNSIILKQISGILIIGTLADIPNTWILNTNLLIRWPKK